MPISRRSLLTMATTGPALALAFAQPASAATLPAVDMEAVLEAAQWDPVKSGSGVTSGAGPSVRLVEQALADRGLLETSYVDGHFGTRTVAAYAQFQQQLGYSGIDATGLPGKTSLSKLGEGRFTVVRVVSVGAHTTVQGYVVNARTLAMSRRPRPDHTYLRPRTGLLLPRRRPDLGRDPRRRRGTRPRRRGPYRGPAHGGRPALRQVGFAAWLRTPSQGSWPLHIHAIAISDTDLAAAAQKQVGAYYEGRNGLANNAADDGPAVTKVTYEEYLRSQQ